MVSSGLVHISDVVLRRSTFFSPSYVVIDGSDVRLTANDKWVQRVVSTGRNGLKPHKLATIPLVYESVHIMILNSHWFRCDS